ncbi:MAG: HAD family phosphatase, partial [Eubacterium sp.]
MIRTEAVIFDMDGLMFDTEPISVDGWVEAGKVMGYPITKEMVFKVFGYNPVGISKYWRDLFGDGFDSDKAMNYRIEYIQDYALKNGVKKKTGLVELLDYLKEQDYRFTIASATQRAVVERFVEIAGISAYFDGVVGGDDIINGKPAPDIYL